MNVELYEKLCGLMGKENVLQQEPMCNHTTFRTGGPAQLYLTPDAEQIQPVLELCRQEKIPFVVIGNGSNLLVGDKGIEGAVIEIGKRMSQITVEGEVITAQAGAMMSAVASRAAAASLTGLEFASGIPGSIGGAVVMNAGAYGGEMKDVLLSATVVDEEGRVLTLSQKELDLSYRHSCIAEKGYFVLEAKLALKNGDKETIYGRIQELKNLRVSKQPLEYPSAGSTFKRPEGYFAGKLIDDAGLRGYRVGDAQVSEKHCGFVINRKNATSAQIRRLMEDVQKTVKEKFGIELEPEVKFIGKF